MEHWYIRFADPKFPLSKLPREMSDKTVLILTQIYLWKEKNKDICPFGFFPFLPANFETKMRYSEEDIARAIEAGVNRDIIQKISEDSFFQALSNAFFEDREEKKEKNEAKIEKIDAVPMKHVEFRGPRKKLEPTIAPPKEGEIQLFDYPHLPCRSAQIYVITQNVLDKLQEKYPTVDAMHELELAKEWLDIFPAKRKAPGGMPKFLDGWFERASKPQKTAVEEKPTEPKDAKGREVL